MDAPPSGREFLLNAFVPRAHSSPVASVHPGAIQEKTMRITRLLPFFVLALGALALTGCTPDATEATTSTPVNGSNTATPQTATPADAK